MMAARWRLKYFSFSQRIFPNFGTLVFIILYFERLSFDDSDGSDPRIGPGSARDRPYLKGLGSNFREGPKLGIGSGSMSRIEGPEGPEDLL